METSGRIQLVNGHFPWEVAFDPFLVTLRTQFTDAELYFRPNGCGNGGSVHMGEAVWCCPDYGNRGVWLRWSSGRRFIPCAMFGDTQRIAEALFEAGLRFNYSCRGRLRDYMAKAYGENTAVTPRDLQWPADVLHEFAEAGHGD